MKIVDVLADSPEAIGNSVESLKQEMSIHIERMREGMDQFCRKLNQGKWSGMDTLRFFKSTVRNENIEHILQYLLLFLNGIPATDDGTFVEPFFQFREFVENEAKLLTENDVVAAILGEFLRSGLLNDSNLADFEKNIQDKHREIFEWTRQADSPTLAGFQTLFRALKEMCLFWFDVRQQDIRRVSRSDIYIYKSIRLLETRNGVHQ
jgi:hypothetical protein